MNCQGKTFEVNGLNLVDCQGCGFLHLFPLPEGRLDYYRDQYHTDGHYERVTQDEQWYRCRARRLLAGFSRAGSLLDVGCGDGLFLGEARRQGCGQVAGVEPNLEGARLARQRGLTVYDEPLDEELASVLLQAWKPFDSASMINVLEHLVEPEALLRRVHGLLAPQGELLLVVPRDFSLAQFEAKGQHGLKAWWVSPDHVNYFSSTELGNLLQRCGFSVFHETTSFPLEFFMTGRGRKCYVGDREAGSKAHRARVRFEMSTEPEVLESLYDGLSRADIGREIILYARKQ